MMSILSNSLVQNKNNTMTLGKGMGKPGLYSLSGGAPNSIFLDESCIENGEIEEMHYLMVKFEKMKK